jgi:hypothetical protein
MRCDPVGRIVAYVGCRARERHADCLCAIHDACPAKRDMNASTAINPVKNIRDAVLSRTQAEVLAGIEIESKQKATARDIQRDLSP